MLINNNKALPFGVVTLVLFVGAVMFKYANVSHCDDLKESLEQGFFMSWQAPNFILVTRDKEQWHVEAQSHESACKAMLDKLGLQK